MKFKPSQFTIVDASRMGYRAWEFKNRYCRIRIEKSTFSYQVEAFIPDGKFKPKRVDRDVVMTFDSALDKASNMYNKVYKERKVEDQSL